MMRLLGSFASTDQTGLIWRNYMFRKMDGGTVTIRVSDFWGRKVALAHEYTHPSVIRVNRRPW